MWYIGEGCYFATGIAIDVPWIRVTDTHGGGLYLNYKVDANSGAARTGHVTMSGSGLYMEIAVNQSAP